AARAPVRRSRLSRAFRADGVRAAARPARGEARRRRLRGRSRARGAGRDALSLRLCRRGRGRRGGAADAERGPRRGHRARARRATGRCGGCARHHEGRARRARLKPDLNPTSNGPRLVPRSWGESHAGVEVRKLGLDQGERLLNEVFKLGGGLFGVETKERLESVSKSVGRELHSRDVSPHVLELKAREVEAIEAREHSKQVERPLKERVEAPEFCVPVSQSASFVPEREEAPVASDRRQAQSFRVLGNTSVPTLDELATVQRHALEKTGEDFLAR